MILTNFNVKRKSNNKLNNMHKGLIIHKPSSSQIVKISLATLFKMPNINKK
jgi:hypothetical protein